MRVSLVRSLLLFSAAIALGGCRSVVVLGDSWAIYTGLELRDVAGCDDEHYETLTIPGTTARWWLDHLDLIRDRIEPLEGPVQVVLVIGLNDELLAGSPDWLIAGEIRWLVRELHAIRPDLDVVQLSYQTPTDPFHASIFAEFGWVALLPRDKPGYYTFVDLSDLDEEVEWQDLIHVTRESERLRVEAAWERKLAQRVSCGTEVWKPPSFPHFGHGRRGWHRRGAGGKADE